MRLIAQQTHVNTEHTLPCITRCTTGPPPHSARLQEEVKLQKKQVEGELAAQKSAYEQLSDQLRAIALKLSDSYSDKNELLKAKAAVEKCAAAYRSVAVCMRRVARAAIESTSSVVPLTQAFAGRCKRWRPAR